MPDSRRGGRRPRGGNRFTMIAFVLLCIGVIVYMVGYGFGGLATPEPEEAAAEAPTTTPPVEEFDATADDDLAPATADDNPAPAGTAPAGAPPGGQTGGPPQGDTATPPTGAPPAN